MSIVAMLRTTGVDVEGGECRQSMTKARNNVHEDDGDLQLQKITAGVLTANWEGSVVYDNVFLDRTD